MFFSGDKLARFLIIRTYYNLKYNGPCSSSKSSSPYICQYGVRMTLLTVSMIDSRSVLRLGDGCSKDCDARPYPRMKIISNAMNTTTSDNCTNVLTDSHWCLEYEYARGKQYYPNGGKVKENNACF